MPQRKRFSAFDELSTENHARAEEAPLSFFDPTPQENAAPETRIERIERLKPSQMLPDRFQPRRLLPASLRMNFFSGKWDCYQTARRWLDLAKSNPDEQQQIDRLLSMGSSFETHGQIKPITGSWNADAAGRYVFQIETGERRFWAACLQHLSTGEKEEPELRVEVIDRPTRQRQVLENRHAEPPSAVGQACEIASLMLAELGFEPDPAVPDEFEFFRKANEKRRLPNGLWERLMPVMQLSRPRMEQFLKILDLPTPMLEKADRARVPERVLREIVLAPQNRWDDLLQGAIHQQLTSEEVAELKKHEPADAPAKPKKTKNTDPVLDVAHLYIRFVNALDRCNLDEQAGILDQIADELVVSKRGEGFLRIADELSELIAARLKRK